MGLQSLKKIQEKTLVDIVETIFVCSLILLIFTGDNLLIYITKPLKFLVAIIPIILFIASKSIQKSNVRISKLWFLITIYLGISVFYTISTNEAIMLWINFCIGMIITQFIFRENVYQNIIKMIENISIILAFSIILEFIFPNLFVNFFSFFLTSSSNIEFELARSIYSGLMGERGYAAIVMNFGVAIIFSYIFTNMKIQKKEIIKLIILMLGLILTSKRMLTAIPIFIYLIITMVSIDKKKYEKMFKFVIIGVIALLILAIFFPSTLNVVKRFIEEDDSNRSILWEYAKEMFREKSIFGYGLGSYNKYTYINGFEHYGGMWSYHVHNCYLQLLAENGIIGFALVIGTILYTLIETIKILRSIKENPQITNTELIYFSLYIQIMMLIYSMTGNPLYLYQQFFVYMFSVSIMIFIDYNLKKGGIPNGNK